jgi:hypothetical protein
MGNLIEFQKVIDKISRGFGCNPHKLFQILKKIGFGRIELMIVDSALKGMPLDNLWHTLLILEQDYHDTIYSMTLALVDNFINQ